MKRTKTQKGITLIALIITIVVLLILAVVAIGVLQNTGIITHAQNATTEYHSKQDEEQIKLALEEWKIVKHTQAGANFGSFLKSRFGENNVSKNDEDEFHIVTIAECGHKYKVYEDGNIEDTEDGNIEDTEDGNIEDTEDTQIRPVISNIKIVDSAGNEKTQKSVENLEELYIQFVATIENGTIESVTIGENVLKAIENVYRYKVTENGFYVFKITGKTGKKTSSEYITVTVNQYKIELEYGSYVKYNVTYKDVYATDLTYDNSEVGKYGWRILNYKENEDGSFSDVKLISTGIPMKYNYSAVWEDFPSWWVFLNSPENDGPAVGASQGLWTNFRNLWYTNEKAFANAENYSFGYFDTGDNKVVGDYFEAEELDVFGVRAATFTDFYTAMRSFTGLGITYDENRDVYELPVEWFEADKNIGLLCPYNLENRAGAADDWWCSTGRYDGTEMDVYRVSRHGLGYGLSGSFGLRPLISLEGNVWLNDSNADGILDIKK